MYYILEYVSILGLFASYILFVTLCEFLLPMHQSSMHACIAWFLSFFLSNSIPLLISLSFFLPISISLMLFCLSLALSVDSLSLFYLHQGLAGYMCIAETDRVSSLCNISRPYKEFSPKGRERGRSISGYLFLRGKRDIF